MGINSALSIAGAETLTKIRKTEGERPILSARRGTQRDNNINNTNHHEQERKKLDRSKSEMRRGGDQRRAGLLRLDQPGSSCRNADTIVEDSNCTIAIDYCIIYDEELDSCWDIVTRILGVFYTQFMASN